MKCVGLHSMSPELFSLNCVEKICCVNELYGNCNKEIFVI